MVLSLLKMGECWIKKNKRKTKPLVILLHLIFYYLTKYKKFKLADFWIG